MSRQSYDQHASYLNHLLGKHENNEGITYEDLQNAWSRLEKHCASAKTKPLEEMNSLHQSLLEKYNSAAKDYYATFLSQYHPPPPSSRHGNGNGKVPGQAQLSMSAESYITRNVKFITLEKWKVEPSQINEWFYNPIKVILRNTYKKEELKVKLNGLKNKQLQLRSANTISTKKQIEKQTLQEETSNMREEAKTKEVVVELTATAGDSQPDENGDEQEDDNDNEDSEHEEDDTETEDDAEEQSQPENHDAGASNKPETVSVAASKSNATKISDTPSRKRSNSSSESVTKRPRNNDNSKRNHAQTQNQTQGNQAQGHGQNQNQQHKRKKPLPHGSGNAKRTKKSRRGRGGGRGRGK